MYGDPRKWYGHFPFLIVFALADFIIRARELEFERNGETLNVDVSTPIVQSGIDRGNVIGSIRGRGYQVPLRSPFFRLATGAPM